MSILRRSVLVEFDPSKKEHRAAVRAFMKRRAWVDSPIRFFEDPEYGSVADQVQQKLLNWYLAQEQSKEIAKATRKSEKMAMISNERTS